MKLSFALISLVFSAVHAAPKSKSKSAHKQAAAPQGIKGIDVSHLQPTVNWAKVKASGVSFAYIKATEGTGFVDKTFASKSSAAAAAGLLRGPYHFAHPGQGTGAAQAQYFLAHGGGWHADGKFLPGAIDLEAPPHKPNPPASCYNLSPAAMNKWITDFSNAYHAATKRYPVIYTTTAWWKTCTGNSPAFGANNPLWLARFNSKMGALPAGWKSATIWQYAEHGPNPGDQDVFLGNAASLKRLAMSE